MITRDIYINSKQVTPPIRIVYGTNNLPVQFCMKDVELASGNTAKFYSLAPSENRYEQAGTIDTSARTITFTPVAGFFETGQNLLQCEITQGGKFLYSFAVDVLCAQNLLEDGTAAEAEAIKTYVERAEDAADSAEASAQAAQDVLDSIPADYSELSDTVDDLVETTEDLSEKVLKAFQTGSASGAVASFPDGADNIPMKSVIAHIEPVQAGSGDPSPENVREISGWTVVNIPRAGKNLWGNISAKKTPSGGVIIDSNTSNWAINTPIRVNGGESMTITIYTDAYLDGSMVIYSYGANRKSIRREFYRVSHSGDTFPYSETFQIASDAAYILVYGYRQGGTGSAILNAQVQLEFGSFATEYEPYVGETYIIQLGQTVYGATINPLAGTGIVDKAIVDLGTLTWAISNNIFYASLSALPSAIGHPNGIPVICDCYKNVAPYTGTVANFPDKSIISSWSSMSTSKRIYVKDTDYSSAVDFKEAMSGHYAVYQLGEPFEIQLTPVQITTLLGQNNIWCDTGDIEVTYRADPALYIDRKINATKSIIAGVEAEMVATQNYTIGQYLIVGDSLYKVTANIATGTAITVGTNVVATTVAEQLITLANA